MTGSSDDHDTPMLERDAKTDVTCGNHISSRDAGCDDSIETVSDGDLSSDHEDGEISEELSDIFR